MRTRAALVLLLVNATAACAGASDRGARAGASAATSASAAPSASAILPDEVALSRVRGRTVALGGAGAPRLTARAAEAITAMIADTDGDRVARLRVFRRCAPEVAIDRALPPDRHVSSEGAHVVADALALAFLAGAEIDFREDAGFTFERPTGAPTCDGPGWTEVLAELDARLATCLGGCHDDACKVDCWCERSVSADYVACASEKAADDARCVGVFQSEWTLCDARPRD